MSQPDGYKPTRGERAYDTGIQAVIAIALLAGIVGFVRSSTTTDTKKLLQDVLAFIGVISIAGLLGRTLYRRFAPRIKRDYLSLAILVAVPFFVLTTLYRWLFPGALHFGEYVISNVLFALLLCYSMKGQRSSCC